MGAEQPAERDLFLCAGTEKRGAENGVCGGEEIGFSLWTERLETISMGTFYSAFLSYIFYSIFFFSWAEQWARGMAGACGNW